MNSSKRRRSRAIFQDFRSGIDLPTQIAPCIVRILRRFNVAERSLHFYVVAVLADVRALRYAPGKKRDRTEAQNSQQNDHAHHNENDFERSASLPGARRRDGSRRNGGSSHNGGRNIWWGRGSEYCGTALVTESDSGGQTCATRIAERHTSPHAGSELNGRREYTAD